MAAVTIAPAVESLTVFIAGDSTVGDQENALYTGWVQILRPAELGGGRPSEDHRS